MGRPADSPRLVLLVGAPRSGTTWLQALLGTHPAIASPQETDLFARYLAPLDAAWEWQMRGTTDDWVARRLKGLPSVFLADEFRDVGRELVRRTLVSVLARKPGASIVLEKSPAHSLHVATIINYVPDAAFVHLVRDGRDVAASLVAAGEGWGAGWAPRDVVAAAAMWAEHVRGARRAAEAAGGYLELRYEALRADGAPLLAAAFRVAGVDVAAAECEELLGARAQQPSAEAGAIARSDAILIGGEFAALASCAEPEGFSGMAARYSWRERWSLAQRTAFAEVAGDLLVELGYEPDDEWVGARPAMLRARRWYRARAGAARSVNALTSRVRRVASRIAP